MKTWMGVVALLVSCSAVTAQQVKPRAQLRSFNLPKEQFGGVTIPPAQQLGLSHIQLQTAQFVTQTRQLNEVINRLGVPGTMRRNILIASNALVQRADQLNLAARQNNLAALPSLNASANTSLANLSQALQPYLGGNLALQQALSQVEYTSQHIDGLLGVNGNGNVNQEREQVARLARAVEAQSEQLRAVIADQGNFGGDALLSKRIRSFGLSNRRLAEAIENGASIQQSLGAYQSIVNTWGGIVQAMVAPYGNNAVVQTQAARTNTLLGNLGKALQGQDWIAPPGPGFLPAGDHCLVVGAGETGGPHVKVCRDMNAPSHDFFAYDVNYRGGVRVAVADLNGDGVPDIVTAPGRDHIPLIRVFDGRDMSLMCQFVAYDPPYDLGVFVAAADMTANGRALVAVGPGVGGPPHVKIFDLVQGKMIDEIYPYPKELRCGARPALGDIDGDGLPDLVTVPGAGNGPHVKIFNGTNGQLLQQFNAFEATYQGGLFVALADVTRNGRADLVIGSEGGRVGQLRVFDSRNGRQIGGVEPFGPRYTGGVRVSVYDVNRDNIPDLVAATGPGNFRLPVRIYNGANSRMLHEFMPFQREFVGGVFVGGR